MHEVPSESEASESSSGHRRSRAAPAPSQTPPSFASSANTSLDEHASPGPPMPPAPGFGPVLQPVRRSRSHFPPLRSWLHRLQERGEWYGAAGCGRGGSDGLGGSRAALPLRSPLPSLAPPRGPRKAPCFQRGEGAASDAAWGPAPVRRPDSPTLVRCLP